MTFKTSSILPEKELDDKYKEITLIPDSLNTKYIGRFFIKYGIISLKQ